MNGNYRLIKAAVGVPSDAQVPARVQFLNQAKRLMPFMANGRVVKTLVVSPQTHVTTIEVPLTGVDQLSIEVIPIAPGNSPEVGFGADQLIPMR